MADGNVRVTSITLTPVSDGRFEIYVDGKQIYDRKESNDGDFFPVLRVIRKAGRQLKDRLEETKEAVAT